MSFAQLYGRYLDRKIVVFDVGCRWGFSNVWEPLAPHVSLYGFDPDEAECANLAERYRGRDVTFVPKALAASIGRRTLYLTREPACSSLYAPAPEPTSSIPELRCAARVGAQEIDVTTLDAWLAESGVRAPDFIKLDVQGAELDVLRGAAACLRDVRALELEVEFNPIYQDQPLFADVDAFLRQQGFVLWRLSNLVHYTDDPTASVFPAADVHYYDSRPVPVPTMAGQLFWGHAFYVRPETAAGGRALDWRQCVADAALMHASGFHDLADRLLRSAARNCPAALADAFPSPQALR
ncbi:FkbM family methyltransferase [Burkholderia thailandensis]|uniref:Methyltransferase, FkbM family domain protein n=1 Tax=Burkholderia thailandensis TaxID=57975 RepID=A0AAW9CV66_BURTH|nr:FkbM family methyltransferase [Burkholderia thailandensis]AHI66592.1 methyltransferase, FkbM family domain protein [Burkholderia thailandensis H0587]AOJ53928.1 methyltransferase FkbM [Burkholderia thailandensis]AVR27930.1 FkbM family methyltransferase [Burkholderia thailandensis]MCS3394305.1 FkbM family methyltransferase [Burkholderia thailandensis]MCS6427393.1 FkbM family methyltransferase [Burkholderia thailandensis]